MGALGLVGLGCGDDSPIGGAGGVGGADGSDGGTGGSEGGAGGSGGIGGEPTPEPDGYPRINMLIWSGASAAWLAEVDWVILAAPSQAAEAKVLNPDLLVTATLDFNLLHAFTGEPDEWRVRQADGTWQNAYDGTYLGNTTDYWADHGREPHGFYVNNNYQGDPDPNAYSKENFRFMRFGLTATLLHDGYYSYADGDGLKGELAQNGHSWVRYFDEYDVPLGQPLGPYATISEEVYFRFFDGGAMILNGSTEDVDVTEDDLIAAAEDQGLVWADIAGEAGHYYRFSGQQNPTFNDGSVLSSVNLPSKETWIGFEGPDRKGDGILLVRAPNQGVVAPVIIDTETFVTSPGAENAVLDGFQGTCGEFNSVIGFRTGYNYCSDVNPMYGYAESDVGQSHSATFSAELVHEGPYRIYEYHPEVDGWDVPHRVHHAGGVETIQVDQRSEVERWNLLGTYLCSQANPCQVVITNEASGTVVAADAIRFQWAGDD